MLLALVASSVLAAAAPEPAPDLRPVAPTPALEDGAGGAAQRPRASIAAASGLALVGADAAVFFGAALLVGATARHPTACEFFCFDPDPTAVAIALLAVAVVPPAFATYVADEVDAAPGISRALLAYAAQGAAIGLVVGAGNSRSEMATKALLASALAVHFVGIPLALGFAPAAATRGGGAPTLSYAVRF